MTQRRAAHAFTLVEILIVVVILGILTAIVIPQYANATTDTRQKATVDQLLKIRNAIDVYFIHSSNVYPTVVAGNGTWGEIAAVGNSHYLRETPRNQWVGGPNASTIIIRAGADTAFTTGYGWIFDPTTGNVWAASFDAADQPMPTP